MIQTKIEPKENLIFKDYSHKVLKEIWVETEKTTELPVVPKGFQIKEQEKRSFFNRLIHEAEEVLCLATETLTDRKLVELLSEKVSHGLRLYLLVNQKTVELSPLFGKAFIKTDTAFRGTLLLIDPSESLKGCFFNDALRDDCFIYENLCVELEKQQAKILYRLFCHWFWNKAEKEIKDKDGKEQESQESPYGIIPISQPEHLTILADKLTVRAATENAVWALANIKEIKDFDFSPQLTSKGCALISLKGNDNASLKELAEHQLILKSRTESSTAIQAHWYAISEEEVYLFPDKEVTSVPFLIRLSKQQSSSIWTYLADMRKKYNLQYFSEQTYKQLEGKEGYKQDALDDPFHIKKHEVATQQEYKVVLLQLENPSWEEHLKEQDIQSCEVNYTIKLKPKKLPDSHNPHKLYKDWEELERKFETKKEELINKVAQIEEQNQGLLQRFKSFIGAFSTGKNTTITILRKDIESLSYPKEAQKEKTERLFENVNELIEKVNQQSKEIGEKTKEAEAKDKDEKEKERCREDVKKKESELRKVEKEIKEAKLALKDLEENGNKIRKQKETEFVEKYFGRKHEGTIIESDYASKNKDLGLSPDKLDWKTISSLIRDKWSSVRKDKKISQDDKTYLQNLNKKAQEIEQLINQREKELDKKLQNGKREEGKLHKDIAHLQEKVEKPFAYQSDKSVQKTSSITRLNKKSKNKSAKPDDQGIGVLRLQEIPKKELPKVGELFELGKENYLVIEYWEEFEEAKIEAERLNVKLDNICIK